MDGDSLPVSAFVGHEDGQFPLGRRRLREARRGRVSVPEWDADTSASSATSAPIVCPHATIRPFALTDEEAGSGSRPQTKHRARQGGKGKR